MTTTDRPRYCVVVRRSGGGWSLVVEGIGGVSRLQVAELASVEPKARKLIWGLTGEDPSSIQLDVDIRLPSDIGLRLARAESLCGEAQEEVETAIVALRNGGLSVRDVSRILGHYKQRPPRPLTITNADLARDGLAGHPEAAGIRWEDHGRCVVSTCRACIGALRPYFVGQPADEDNVLVYETPFLCDRCPSDQEAP